jgi:hypothetical protein
MKDTAAKVIMMDAMIAANPVISTAPIFSFDRSMARNMA